MPQQAHSELIHEAFDREGNGVNEGEEVKQARRQIRYDGDTNAQAAGLNRRINRLVQRNGRTAAASQRQRAIIGNWDERESAEL